jgi:hypothetical protein
LRNCDVQVIAPLPPAGAQDRTPRHRGVSARLASFRWSAFEWLIPVSERVVVLPLLLSLCASARHQRGQPKEPPWCISRNVHHRTRLAPSRRFCLPRTRSLAGVEDLDPTSSRAVAEFIPVLNTRTGFRLFAAPGNAHGEHPELAFLGRLRVKKRFFRERRGKALSICRPFPARSTVRPGQSGCDRRSSRHNTPRGRFRRC